MKASYGSVNIDTQDLDKLLQKLDAKSQKEITVSALNKTIIAVRDEAKQVIPEVYNIKKSDVKLTTTKAKTIAVNPFARIRALYKPISLERFNAVQTPAGVSVQVIRSGGNKTISSAFIERPQGRDWKRYGQKKQVTSKKDLVLRAKNTKGFFRRYPLESLAGPSLGAMLTNEKVMKRVQLVIDNELPKNVYEAWEDNKNRFLPGDER